MSALARAQEAPKASMHSSLGKGMMTLEMRQHIRAHIDSTLKA